MELCSQILKNGHRCSRKANADEGLCKLHYSLKYKSKSPKKEIVIPVKPLKKKINTDLRDVFEFDEFPEEKALFSKYFIELELDLRLAIFLDNKYNENLEMDFKKSKKSLIKLTDEFSFKQLLYLWFYH